MNSIDQRFARLKKERRKGIIAYLTAGDPDLNATERFVLDMACNGVDMIELGVPFSDPVADGPVIQAASARALAGGVRLADVLRLAEKLRLKTNIPLLMMSYYNPIYSFGLSRFADHAFKAGIDGIIVPDLPLEESEGLLQSLRGTGIYLIHFISPTSSESRIKATIQQAGGFIYCISAAGVTGVRNTVPETARELLIKVHSMTELPLALGFGVSSPEHIKALGEQGDAVIIGSAIMKLIEQGGDRDIISQKIKGFLSQFNGIQRGE